MKKEQREHGGSGNGCALVTNARHQTAHHPFERKEINTYAICGLAGVFRSSR